MLFSGAINGFPVYRRSKAGITAKEILQLCIDGDLPDKNMCKRVPVGVTNRKCDFYRGPGGSSS